MTLPKDLVHLVMTFVEGRSTSEAILMCLQHYTKRVADEGELLPDFQYKLKLTDGLGRTIGIRWEVILHFGGHRVEIFEVNRILVSFSIEMNQNPKMF